MNRKWGYGLVGVVVLACALVAGALMATKAPGAIDILGVGVYVTLTGALLCFALALCLGAKRSGMKAIRIAPSIGLTAVIIGISHIGGSSPLLHTVHTIAIIVSLAVVAFVLYLVWAQRAKG